MRLWTAAAVCVVLVGCDPEPTSVASPEPLFTLTLDGEPVDVTAVNGEGRVALSSLVSAPIERWTSVTVEGARGSRVRVARPAEEQLGYDLLLHPGEGGTLSFGLYRDLDDVPGGLRERYARPKVAVLDVTNVAVRTVEPKPEPTPVPDRTVATIEGDEGSAQLSLRVLYDLPELEVPRTAPPDATRRARKEARARGRSLAAALKSLGVQAPAGILLRSARDGEVLVSADALASGPGALLRINRRGGLVVELLDGSSTNRLRDVETLVVQPAP